MKDIIKDLEGYYLLFERGLIIKIPKKAAIRNAIRKTSVKPIKGELIELIHKKLYRVLDNFGGNTIELRSEFQEAVYWTNSKYNAVPVAPKTYNKQEKKWKQGATYKKLIEEAKNENNWKKAHLLSTYKYAFAILYMFKTNFKVLSANRNELANIMAKTEEADRLRKGIMGLLDKNNDRQN